MGLKLIPIIMLHLTSNIKSSRQLLKETVTILVLTDSIESNTWLYYGCTYNHILPGTTQEPTGNTLNGGVLTMTIT